MGMGKYIQVHTNHEITEEVLIEISDKTILGLVLPEIVYNIKKKLGFIFVEVWRITSENISINTLNARPEEASGVYAKED